MTWEPLPRSPCRTVHLLSRRVPLRPLLTALLLRFHSTLITACSFLPPPTRPSLPTPSHRPGVRMGVGGRLTPYCSFSQWPVWTMVSHHSGTSTDG